MYHRGTVRTAAVALGLLLTLGGADAARRSRSNPDRLFMVKAAHINIGEVKGGQLALTRAVNASVRDYAQMMIRDHSQANVQLKRLAAQEGVRLPNDTDQKHKALANRLAKLSGAPFDRAFMQAMVQGHRNAIALFTNEAQNGRDPQVRAWASATLPALRKHLQHAQQLANSRAVRTGEKMTPAPRTDGMNGQGQGGGDQGGQNDQGAGGGQGEGVQAEPGEQSE
jgi:putative membrane protein